MEQASFEDEQEQSEAATDGSEKVSLPTDYEELCGQLAQKDRDLVLAAELGKALLESNQELQRRYDAMSEECSLKIESLQQEKYNFHLEFEKLDTEHRNKLKDLHDDITTLREQLHSSTQHQQDNDAETSKTLFETKQKSDYLAEQIQQACKREEELQEELEKERAKSETNLCVIQDHLEHITMLREQVEFLSEKLRETTQALLDLQDERDRQLLVIEKTQERNNSLNETVKQQEGKIKSQENRIKQLEAQLQSKAKKHSTSAGKLSGQKHHSSGTSHLPRPKGRGSKHQLKDQPQRQSYVENITSDSQLVPSFEQGDAETDSTPSSSSDVGNDENLTQVLPRESLLTEFATTVHHHRNRSDCSVISISEGSRKRHHETMAGDSDDETENSDKSSVCKQTLYSEVVECSSFVSNSSKRDELINNCTYFQSVSDSNRSDFPTPAVFNGAQNLNITTSHHPNVSSPSVCSSPSPSNSVTSSEDYDDVDLIDSMLPYSCQSENVKSAWKCQGHAPVGNEASLFEELSSKLVDLNRQNSNSASSEKSLFDELSTTMRQEEMCGSSKFVPAGFMGHPVFSTHTDVHDGYCGQLGARRSEDESSYTCEWPLLTSVSADMLDGDDFECDDDDFLVGNVAGSTLSIGDSGVGIMLNSFSSKADLTAISKQSLESSSGQVWTERMDTASSDKQDLTEACRLMRDLVDRLQRKGGGIHDLSSPESEMPEYNVENASFDILFSLIKKARNYVDDKEHAGVSHLKKFNARQWQLGNTEPMLDEFKIPRIEYTSCQTLPHWTKRKELKRSSSFSSLLLRRSL